MCTLVPWPANKFARRWLHCLFNFFFFYWPNKKKSHCRIEVDVTDTNAHTHNSVSLNFMHAEGVHNTSLPDCRLLPWNKNKSDVDLCCKWTDCVCVETRQTSVWKLYDLLSKGIVCVSYFLPGNLKFSVLAKKLHNPRKWQQKFHGQVMTSKAWCYFSQ